MLAHSSLTHLWVQLLKFMKLNKFRGADSVLLPRSMKNPAKATALLLNSQAMDYTKAFSPLFPSSVNNEQLRF